MPVTRPRRRATVACTACRQSKVQCAWIDGKPPCSRCRRLALECTVDRQYRRIHKTTQVEELQAQLAELRRHFSASGPSPGSLDSPNPVEDGTLGRSATPHLTANSNTTGATRVSSTEQSSSSVFSRTEIRDVILSEDQIEELFQMYRIPRAGPYAYADGFAASLMIIIISYRFWMKGHLRNHIIGRRRCYTGLILAIATRQYRRESSLLNRMGLILSETVWLIFGICPMTVPNIQTLLLLSIWPLPNVHLWNDTSLVMCNTALTCALHLGLHRPGREEEYTRDTVVMGGKSQREESTEWSHKLRERSRTWCACVAVAQR